MHRLSSALCLPLLFLSACDRAPENGGDQQAGVVTDIVDQSRPKAQDVPAPANVTTPVESAPQGDSPSTEGVIPAAMQGRWTGEAERCGDRSNDLELTVAPDQLLFHESVGTVKNVKAGEDGRATVEAAFTGEGQSWTRSLTLRMAKDGKALTIVNDGTAVTRKRC